MSNRPYGSGKLTSDDHALIDQLAAKGWTSGMIARRIKRHQATVAWYMYQNGLKKPQPASPVRRMYVRGGRIVRSWTPDEEALAVALRKQGLSYRAIAEAVNVQYGTERTTHSVQVRLIMLANVEEEDELQEAIA